MAEAPSDRGYVTMAVGRRHFLEMAVDMALSLREHTRYPIALVADAEIARTCEATYAGVFDHISLLPDRFLEGRGRKYGTAEASPFEEAMFVDADCVVLGDLDHLFSSLDRSDLAMCGSQLTSDHDENHHGFSTRWLIERFGLERYMKTNSGIFCFRRSAALEIMEECLRCFVHELRPRLRWQLLRGRWLGDEIAFGVVGGRRNLGMLPVPAPMYWRQEFEMLDLDVPTKPLLHLIWTLRPEALEQLVAVTTRHRARAGLPPGSGGHWRQEAASLESMVKRRRMLERLKVW